MHRARDPGLHAGRWGRGCTGAAPRFEASSLVSQTRAIENQLGVVRLPFTRRTSSFPTGTDPGREPCSRKTGKVRRRRPARAASTEWRFAVLTL